MPLSPSVQEMLKCLEDRDFPTEKASSEFPRIPSICSPPWVTGFRENLQYIPVLVKIYPEAIQLI